MASGGGIRPVLGLAVEFTAGVVRRFVADDGLKAASALSYTSILALVPLLAVGFSLVGAFPAAAAMLERLQDYLFENFLPGLGPDAVVQLKHFLGNASQLGALPAVLLAVTVVLTLQTVERTLNAIWRVAHDRPPLQQILAYWAMVTLGPLLFGLALTLSSYAFAVGQAIGLEHEFGQLSDMALLLPWVLELAGFTLLYAVIPNRAVRLGHALIGAAVATVAFEALKRGFGLYVAAAGSTRTIYGALSAVPLFLVWTYASWTVALIGAEIAAFLPEWNARRKGFGGPLGGARRRLHLALAVLALLHQQARTGGPVGRKRLRDAIPAAFSELDDLLGRLEDRGFIAHASEHWWLARDLGHAPLYELLQALDLGLDLGLLGAAPQGTPRWLAPLEARLRHLIAAEQELGALPLAELLAGTAGAGEQLPAGRNRPAISRSLGDRETPG